MCEFASLSEIQQQSIRPLKTRIKKSWQFSSMFYIEYKRGRFSPWRRLRAFPNQYVMPERKGHTYLYETMLFMGMEAAQRVASGFTTEADLDIFFAYQKHLHETVYKNADLSSLYVYPFRVADGSIKESTYAAVV